MMPKNCGDCEKYPMCSLYSNVSRIIQEEAVLDNTYFVFISIASHCKYYKEVKDEE